MGAKISSEMRNAIVLVKSGRSPAVAARLAGVSESGLSRALKRDVTPGRALRQERKK